MRLSSYWVIAALGIGYLQAWDSGAFDTTARVAWLALIGVLLPALSLAPRFDQRLRFAALAVGVVLLTWARVVSPVSLNTLHVSIFPAALAILFVAGRQPRSAGGA
jgi:hypothetical protein